jgi:hypothetical protein
METLVKHKDYGSKSKRKQIFKVTEFFKKKMKPYLSTEKEECKLFLQDFLNLLKDSM